MANPFNASAKKARANGSHALANRMTKEGQVVSKLVKHALASGYVVSVNDGEEWVVKLSSNYTEIMAACYSTDMDYLTFRDPSKAVANLEGDKGAPPRVGTVTLVYGNEGHDVISDYTAPDLDAFSAWIKPVEDYAETLEG